MKNILILAAFLTAIPALACKDCKGHANHKPHSHSHDNAAAKGKSAEATNFGKPVPMVETALSVQDAVAKFDSVKGKEIAVMGKVVDVCTEEGCWMKITDGKTLVHITLADHSFFLPKTARNKKAVVLGTLQEREMSVAEARHYAKDAGKSKKEIAAITAPVKSFEMMATGVKLL